MCRISFWSIDGTANTNATGEKTHKVQATEKLQDLWMSKYDEKKKKKKKVQATKRVYQAIRLGSKQQQQSTIMLNVHLISNRAIKI